MVVNDRIISNPYEMRKNKSPHTKYDAIRNAAHCVEC